ncbi:MAG TPA: hypothetical protein VGK10_14550 [Prolixibacteraceae bacterium]|jgi:hypothetical protein
MYSGFLQVHDILRWLLLFVLVITLVKYIAGWMGKHPWKKVDNFLGIAFTSLMDLQLLIGLGLYFFLSPLTEIARADMGAAMKNADLRFYAVEHFAIMLAAVVVVHIGRAKSKKAEYSAGKFKIASIYFLIALALILGGIPWSRM